MAVTVSYDEIKEAEEFVRKLKMLQPMLHIKDTENALYLSVFASSIEQSKQLAQIPFALL